jgi:hypothetical protein
MTLGWPLRSCNRIWPALGASDPEPEPPAAWPACLAAAADAAGARQAHGRGRPVRVLRTGRHQHHRPPWCHCGDLRCFRASSATSLSHPSCEQSGWQTTKWWRCRIRGCSCSSSAACFAQRVPPSGTTSSRDRVCPPLPPPVPPALPSLLLRGRRGGGGVCVERRASRSV